jgi:hypothetical protein
MQDEGGRRRFPHAVFYQLFDNQSVILAARHTRRDRAPILESTRSQRV